MAQDNLASKRKPRRTNISSTRNVLTVEGKDPDFEYRIVNDAGDRVAQFEERGYEVVTDNNIKVGDRRIANPTKEGSPVQISVGGGSKAYLMRIKKEWAAEDRKARDELVNETERAMLKDTKESADYGKVTVSAD